MTNSVQRNPNGPLWPLGILVVATPGTPVGFMSNVDPNSYNAPETATPSVPQAAEFTVRCQELVIQAVKPGASHGTQKNAGQVYILVAGAPPGTGNRDDTGSIILTLQPGDVFFLSSAAMNFNVWSPYRLHVDADNAGDGVQVTLIVQ